ncbi:MAG: M28 family peptidase [Chloroflexia bacterium]
MSQRILSLLLVSCFLAGFLSIAQAGVAESDVEPLALVQVAVSSLEDLRCFVGTGLPAYARLQGAEGEYLLAGVGSTGWTALNRCGLTFRILDPDGTTGSYVYAIPGPGRPAPDWTRFGRVLLDDGEGVLLRLESGDVSALTASGLEVVAIRLEPKPLLPALEGEALPAVVTPDPLIQTMIDQVVTATVRSYNRQLAGELPVWVDGEWYTIPTRYTYSGTPIQKTTRWVGQHFESLGLDVEYHQWGGPTYPNVIGELPGLVNPDEIFVICAHVDDVQNTPGADDNGSGSTAVLLAADILTQYRWGCTLRFALWTGEEQGLLGSYAYAQRARSINENIVNVLNLDMIAWNTPASSPGIDLYARTTIPPSVALAQLFSDVVEAYDLNLIPQILTSGGSGSDNSSFWQQGYSAILGIEDNDDFNPYYHSSGDTPAHTDLAYFTEFVKAALATFAHATGCLLPSGLGAVQGHVTDESTGLPVPAAQVAAQDAAGRTFRTTTDETGYYTRTLLPGTYTLTVRHPAYQTAVVTGVQVLSHTATTVDWALRLRGQLWGYVEDWDNGFPLEAVVLADDGTSVRSDSSTGYYEIYLDEGLHTLTATLPNYFPQSVTLQFVSGQSVRHDFDLAAEVSFVPKPVEIAIPLSVTVSQTVALINRRAAPYPFETYEVGRGFVPGVEGVWPGPDGFGYTGEEVELKWIELRGNGTPVPGLTDDSYAGPFPIGFPFPFYGVNRNSFYVSSNGFLTFDFGSSDYTNDCPLPNGNSPNNLVALMWDDLYPNYASGGVYYRTFASCPVGSGKCLVVEYDNWAHCCTPTNIAGTFEVVLFENGSVLVQVLDGGSEEGAGSTTGIEGNNVAADHGLTYACDTPGSLPDGLAVCTVYSGSAGCVASNVPWLGETPESGEVPGNSTLELTLWFSATATAGVTRTGDYYASLVVNGSPKIQVPVTMTVVGEPMAPAAAFVSNSPVCLGDEGVFTDTSFPGIPPASQLLWDFGDGITSTLRNPRHLYGAAGEYPVAFTLCNGVGCDTAFDTFGVLPPPVARFTYTVDMRTVTFTNTSTAATGYLWDFGDGTTSSEVNPIHTYAADGAYTVTLRAIGSCGENVKSAIVRVRGAGGRIFLPLVLRRP